MVAIPQKPVVPTSGKAGKSISATLLYNFLPTFGVYMNDRETKILKEYEAAGWKVLRGGAPDFLCLKIENDKILEVKAVEVKSTKDDLTYEQGVWKRVFEEFLEVSYVVEVVE